MSYLRGPLTREQIKQLVEPTKRQVISASSKISPSIHSATSSALIGSFVTASKPVLPPEIPEYYVPFEKNVAGNNLAYRPVILGAAQVRFSDSKSGIDMVKSKVFVTPVTDNPLPVNWDEAKETNVKVADLKNAPPQNLPFADLPSEALKAKNYSDWKKDFSNWLARTQKIQLFKSPCLDEISKPEEPEREFRIRLQQTAREKRDAQVDKLRQKYSSAFARLDERVRRAQMVVEEQEAQAKGQKYQVAASIGESLLSSFLGRRSSTRVTRASREISRSMKESRDKQNAEENLKAVQQERARLESQFKSEVAATESKTNPLNENLVTLSVGVGKTDIDVQLLSLVWIAE